MTDPRDAAARYLASRQDGESADGDEESGTPPGIAAAVEKGPMPEIDVKIRPTRLVVFGDSDFVSNNALLAGNVDFFMSALNWLLEREELMAISSKAVEQTRLVMNRFQLRVVLWIVVVVLPLLVALVGGLVWVRRRV